MEKNCNTCRHSYEDDGNWKPCREDCTGYSCWQPREKSVVEKITDRLCNVLPDFPLYQPPKKAKETKMWKKLRKRGRRITMAWDLFGLFLLCRLANPWMFKFWHWVMPPSALTDDEVGIHIGHWILTIASIAALLGALYGLDRLAAWWYGEEK